MNSLCEQDFTRSNRVLEILTQNATPASIDRALERKMEQESNLWRCCCGRNGRTDSRLIKYLLQVYHIFLDGFLCYHDLFGSIMRVPTLYEYVDISHWFDHQLT